MTKIIAKKKFLMRYTRHRDNNTALTNIKLLKEILAEQMNSVKPGKCCYYFHDITSLRGECCEFQYCES